MLVLYHNDMSVCAQKVRLQLAEKALPHDARHLDIRNGEARTPDYLKLNPNAVVPTIVDNGLVVIESSVIVEYIEDAYPDLPLRPEAPHERALMRLWTRQLDDSVHKATAALSLGIAFRHQHLEKSPAALAAHIEGIPDPVRRIQIRDAIENGVKAADFGAALKRFVKLLDAMEEALAGRRWLAGDSYSLADISLAPYILRLEHLFMHPMIEKRPRLAAWLQRIKARPAYEDAIGNWLNPRYLALMEEKGREAWPGIAAQLS